MYARSGNGERFHHLTLQRKNCFIDDGFQVTYTSRERNETNAVRDVVIFYLILSVYLCHYYYNITFRFYLFFKNRNLIHWCLKHIIILFLDVAYLFVYALFS